MPMEDIALVSCVKSKRPVSSEARDLYVSALFRSLRAYAESHAREWYILSAEHGLLLPYQVIPPYERTLLTMHRAERVQWAAGVCAQLARVVERAGESKRVIFLAGQRYREFIEPFLLQHGHRVIVPLQGMSIGMQLAWLKRANAKED